MILPTKTVELKDSIIVKAAYLLKLLTDNQNLSLIDLPAAYKKQYNKVIGYNSLISAISFLYMIKDFKNNLNLLKVKKNSKINIERNKTINFIEIEIKKRERQIELSRYEKLNFDLIVDIYQESGLIFKDNVIKKIKEVEDFHRQASVIIVKRLTEEVKAFKNRLLYLKTK